MPLTSLLNRFFSRSASERERGYGLPTSTPDKKRGEMSRPMAGKGSWSCAQILGTATVALLLLAGISYRTSLFDMDAMHKAMRGDKFPETFRIAVIADLDTASKKDGGKSWYSIFMTGTLRRSGESYDITWDPASEVSTGHNEAGRGCELSELVRFGDRLYTFDDRSGIMFEVMNPARSDTAPAPYLVPRHIFSEGGGSVNDKGLKIEWATVREKHMLVGSFGKEFTNNKGEIMHSNNLWVVQLDSELRASHHDWKPNYDAMRTALGYNHPGYLLHETVLWSPARGKWLVFPRRMSKEAYDDVQDEKRGANTVIIANHDFSDVTAKTIGKRTPERGFSSAKFLPISNDKVVIALKSEENAAEGTQRTFLAVYGEVDGEWRTLLDETALPIERKFEGIEVLSAL